MIVLSLRRLGHVAARLAMLGSLGALVLGLTQPAVAGAGTLPGESATPSACTAAGPAAITATSPRWAGYVAEAPARCKSPYFTSVTGAWTQPVIYCPKANKGETRVDFWVGLDGYLATSKTAERAGVSAYCAWNAKGRKYAAYYLAWYQLSPSAAIHSQHGFSALKPLPGTTITATVTFSPKAKSNPYQLTITVSKKGTKTQSATASAACASKQKDACGEQTAEWVADRAATQAGTYYTLADFSPWTVTKAYATTAASTARRPASALNPVQLSLRSANSTLAYAYGLSGTGLTVSRTAPTYIYWDNYTYYGSGGSIGRALVNGTDVSRNFITGTAGPVGLASASGYLYWSNPASYAGSPGTTIGRATLNGTGVNQNFITGVSSPHSVAISGNYVYWVSRFGNSIGRAKLNGTGVNPDFITGAYGPWGIAVGGGYIYWTNFGESGPGASDGTTIGRAKLNGTGVNQAYITGASAPAGIAVSGGYLYWSNFGYGASGTSIGRATVNGTGVNEDFITGAQVPSGIAVSGGYIYWSNYGGSAGGGTTIGRAKLNGTGVNQAFIKGADSPTGITIATAN